MLIEDASQIVFFPISCLFLPFLPQQQFKIGGNYVADVTTTVLHSECTYPAPNKYIVVLAQQLTTKWVGTLWKFGIQQ